MITTHEACSLPKVELHAHLNGSVRLSTLRELSSGCAECVSDRYTRGVRSLPDCFKLFAAIHEVTTSLDVVRRITTEVCEDWEADHVVYGELRTSPKHRPEHGISKRTYVESVLDALQSFRARNPPPRLRINLLLSIDRRESSEAAQDTVNLALEFQGRGVCGVDLSGNPAIGTWHTWLPALERARKGGLKVTVHAGEVENEAELDAILAFKPDRIGHFCCSSGAQEQYLLDSRIPLELCLSSNLVTGSVPCIDAHHFDRFWAAGHPVALCTDDSAVFGTTLSQEFLLASEAFQLSVEDCLRIGQISVDSSFADDGIKSELHRLLADCTGQLLRLSS